MSLAIDARSGPYGRGVCPDITDRAERDDATAEAIRRMCRPGCPPQERERLREQVVRWHLPMAHRLARGYRDRGEHLDDLMQVAAMALVKAVDGYRPDRGTSFASYATPTILGEVKRHFRDRVWSVHVPRQLQERCLEVTRVRAALVQGLQRSPSLREIADALGVSEADVRATESSTSAYRADSLNRRVGFEQDACERLDLLGEQDADLTAVCDRVTLRAALEQLPARERYVVHRYFFEHRTQDQIAAELRTSQMTVSRLLAHTLTMLRARLAAGSAPDDGTGETAGPRIHTYEARPGCLIATVGAPTQGSDPGQLREELVRLAVTRRPRALVVDLRRLRDPGPGVLRALVDTYRAGGHTGTRLRVVNVAPCLFEAMRRAGVIRLFPCHAVACTAPAATDRSSVIGAVARPAPPAAPAGRRPGPARPVTPRGDRRPRRYPPVPARRGRRCAATGGGRHVGAPPAVPVIPAGPAGRSRPPPGAGSTTVRRPLRGRRERMTSG
jgi:RNA polymerase sigma-B factor